MAKTILRFRSQCPACDRFFHTSTDFDAHRIGKFSIYPRMPGFADLPDSVKAQVRHCMTEEQMHAAGLVFDPEKNEWAKKVHRAPMTEERKLQLKEQKRQKRLERTLHPPEKPQKRSRKIKSWAIDQN